MAQAPWIVVTGLDGSGKTTLAQQLARDRDGFFFRLPYHDFVRSALTRSGYGRPFGDVHTDRLIFAADARRLHSSEPSPAAPNPPNSPGFRRLPSSS
jgi:thymidylate kinase